MPKNIYARTIYFLCGENNVTNTTIKQLAKRMGYPIPRLKPEDLFQTLHQHKHRILLIDHEEYTQFKSQIRELPLVNRSFETIIFNVTCRLTTDEILAFGHLKGIFRQNDSLNDIARGCESIINGENWLPRKVDAQLLFYYRSVVETQTAPATVDLTAREIQILRCLMVGASNTQIAEDMFISEFTVKSHLQKIFKKLSVRNRVQAAAWAKQHMHPAY
jgi:DNA-binding NarL/FixJ family response regulator